MHCRFYTLQTMHKVAEQAQSQTSSTAGEQWALQFSKGQLALCLLFETKQVVFIVSSF